MANWAFTKGLHDLGNGVYAYLQPGGGWGWSNAGLIVDGGRSMLVDTLFDLPKTRDMLDAMTAATPAARSIDSLVNTHANGDHTFGNELVAGAEIIASKAGAEEMADLPPAAVAGLMRGAPEMGETGAWLLEIFGAFDFEGITLTPPTATFSGETTRRVGAKEVRLIEVGPAHTKGDVLVHVPAERTVFTGDILFVDGTPIIWAGPVANWIAACDRILAMDVETVVPGHGPISGKDAVRDVRGYLVYVDAEARKRYDAGLSLEQAINDIALGDYSSWGDSERIAVNVATLYREFAGDTAPPDVMGSFAMMARIARG